jgi:hypothetical protein
MILGKWPTWRTILYYVFIFIFNSRHVSSTSCSSSGETDCVNTTSGNCHYASLAVSCAGRKWTHFDTVCLSWWWARCARNMLRVKNKNKYIVKNCASRWSFTKNHKMMHGQQNVKLCFYTFDVILLRYISLPIWPNVNTSCTTADRERCSVFKEITESRSLTTYGAYHLSPERTEENRVKPRYCQYPGLLPKHTYTHNFGAQLNTVDNKANNSSYLAVCNSYKVAGVQSKHNYIC